MVPRARTGNILRGGRYVDLFFRYQKSSRQNTPRSTTESYYVLFDRRVWRSRRVALLRMPYPNQILPMYIYSTLPSLSRALYLSSLSNISFFFCYSTLVGPLSTSSRRRSFLSPSKVQAKYEESVVA